MWSAMRCFGGFSDLCDMLMTVLCNRITWSTIIINEKCRYWHHLDIFYHGIAGFIDLVDTLIARREIDVTFNIPSNAVGRMLNFNKYLAWNGSLSTLKVHLIWELLATSTSLPLHCRGGIFLKLKLIFHLGKMIYVDVMKIDWWSPKFSWTLLVNFCHAPHFKVSIGSFCGTICYVKLFI